MIRLFDILFALIAITLLLPLFMAVSLVLLIFDQHQVFFFQDRIGQYGKKISIIKFVTMKPGSELLSGHTINNDPRVTRIGRFLRQTKINELTQLLNVLKGEMTLIGYRPLVEETFVHYAPEVKQALWFMKPGLSGIGSIIFRDEEKLISNQKGLNTFYIEVITRYKGDLELWHSKNLSIRNYFILIILTIYSVIKNDNRMLYKIFNDLPKPPDDLLEKLH